MNDSKTIAGAKVFTDKVLDQLVKEQEAMIQDRNYDTLKSAQTDLGYK